MVGILQWNVQWIYGRNGTSGGKEEDNQVEESTAEEQRWVIMTLWKNKA